MRVAQQDYDDGWRSNDWGPWSDDTHGYGSYSNRKSDPGMRDAILKLLGTCRKDTYRISWNEEVVGLADVWNVLSLIRFRFVARWDLDLAVGAYLEKLRLGD